jgi:hypothetical protein
MNRAQYIARLVEEKEVNEGTPKLTARFRGGKLQRKLVCPKFFKKKGMACLKLTAAEAKKLSKVRKKVFKRKLRMKLARILKKRAISMQKREIILGTPVKIVGYKRDRKNQERK